MHQTAFEYVSKLARTLPPRRSVLELGSKSVNGGVRNIFANADTYHGIDLSEGDGVDEVADAADYRTEKRFDTVICCEVLEHTNRAREICANAYRHLARYGVFIVTAAAVGRPAHSAVDGGELKEGEFYRNVTARELRWWLSDFPLVLIDTDTEGDIYACAIRG